MAMNTAEVSGRCGNRIGSMFRQTACLAVLGGIILAAAPLAAQEAAEADAATLLGRAVQAYDSGDYQASIDDLSRLLQTDPQNATARFMRALAHGQLAVPSEQRAQLARSRDQHDEAGTREQAAATEYRAMRDDLDALMGIGLNDATAIAQLINGVVTIKLASYAPGSHQERLATRAKLLAEARAALERYLNPPSGSGVQAPTGLNRVRAEYFRGVVVYRQAVVPSENPDEPDCTADRAALDQAGELMQALADPASDQYIVRLMPGASESETRAWLSYANLYLGLIRTRQGSQGPKGAFTLERCYEDAIGYFGKAWELDTGEPYPQGEEKSAGRGLIPQIAQKHIPEIEKAMQAPAGRTEDLFLDWEMGFAYDTNVILLGDHTLPPRNIGRRRDVRVGTGFALGYTLDLGKVDESLDRLTIGMMGRAAGSWHGAIKEYNEQDYGASVALQYRMIDAWEAGGHTHGPLYASIQYDYDYFLLGNNGFLRLNRVSPQFTLYSFDQHATTGLGFHYEDRNYLEPLSSNLFDRDGNYYGFSLSQAVDVLDMTDLYTSLGWEPWGLRGDPADPNNYNPDDPTQDPSGYQRWLRPFIGFEYGWDSTTGTEFDADRYVLAAGMLVPLPYGVQFDFGSQWEWQDYYHRGSLIDFHRRAREDLIQRYRFGLERRFVLIPGHRSNRTTAKIDRLVMSLRGDVQLVDDDSNVKDRLGQAVFSYDRALWGLSVAFKFN